MTRTLISTAYVEQKSRRMEGRWRVGPWWKALCRAKLTTGTVSTFWL